ncbi:MAG: tetratricopeptide repeat protein [Anaerolineae bacterium]|nr:tetratricopeptide repeat protein [Anaerolineae bacterium]
MGRREVYEHFMNMGHGFAWDQTWDKAVAAYARALQEIPEDPESHKYLGLALLQSKRYADALKVYTRAHQLAPDDPVPLEKSADVLERLGRLKEAAQQYISVADIYLAQRDIEKAIGNFERATLLTPGLLQIHYRLAQLYERTGRKRAAVLQYLTLSFNFQRAKDRTRALQAIERAIRLEPNNPQVLNAKQAIEVGELMAVPQTETTTPRAGAPSFFEEPAHKIEPPSADAHPGGPLGEATEMALAALAEHLLEGGLTTASAQAIQAIELHKVQDYPAALAAYQSAEKQGIRHISIYMALGAVSIALQNWADAKRYLERAATHQPFASGAAHGIGQALMGLSKPREASEKLVQALQLVDISLAMGAEEASQLTAVYDQLRLSSQGMMDRDLDAMNANFNRWLTGPDWKVRIPETRRALADRMRSGASEELRDYVANTAIVDLMAQVDGYIRAGLLTLAMDESMRAVEIEPTSLPAHKRIAQILMAEGRIQDAITKYNVVANSFLARDDRVNAATILDEVIKVAPMDTGLRLSLIDLLEREGQEARMLEEYIGLAGAYYQLAEIDQARDTYQEALKLAQRLGTPPEKRAEILYSLADIYMSRLDFRQAQRTYEQIRSLLPDDERPRRELIDLNYRLNSPMEAVRELDGLLRLYAQKKRGDLIVGALEQMVNSRTEDMALRSRLAAVYRQLNRRADAMAQLDKLGELQLDAGLYKEACATIKQIVALNPPEVEQYLKLLSQLGCG